MNGYTACQLLSYHAYCRDNPTGSVLPPGGRAGWDDMSAAEWMSWFHWCLEMKINRNLPQPAWRKLTPGWQSGCRRLAAHANSRIILRPRDVPNEFKLRLANRITQPWEE
jgi:hypothetical protein